MELRHLRYFAAVAEAASFSRAAERLRVAQPALSRQVRDLEEEMGAKLFVRSPVRVELTDAGRVFLTHVQKLLTHVDLAVTAAQQAARGNDGRLVICNDWRLSIRLIPECVLAFRAEHPRVEIELADLPMHEQLEALSAGHIHLGFLPREFIGARDDMESLTVICSDYVVAMATGHPSAGRRHVRLAELADETWVGGRTDKAREYRNHLIQMCRLAGFSPTFGKAVSSLEAMLAHVASGYGIALLPGFVVPAGEHMVRFVPTDCEPLELCAVWRRDSPSVPLRRFLALVRKSVENRAKA
jgi:DNA-binding transcriptional LysR family regulator